MHPTELARVLGALPDGPTIVCAQAGEVNTGAFDPLDAIADVVATRPGTRPHIDGAFGLWVAATRSMREYWRGHDRADSWTTDCHKWLNDAVRLRPRVRSRRVRASSRDRRGGGVPSTCAWRRA